MKQYTVKTYRVNILGVTWEGLESSYSKGLPKKPEITCLADCKKLFGDFQSVIDYRIQMTRTVFEMLSETKNRETITRETIKPFTRPESEETFCHYETI